MKKLILSAVVLAVCALVPAAADTIIETVNFDAPGGINGDNYGGAPVTGPGAPGADSGVAATPEYWNPIALGTTTAMGAALASDGTTHTGITLTEPVSNHFDFGSPSPITLFNPYVDGGGNTNTITLNKVPAGLYNLFIYSQNGGFAGRGGAFTLNGNTQYVSNNGDQTSFVLGTNYTEFTGISLTSPGSISFSWAPWHAQGNTLYYEADFNGLQLQSVSVPEPTTWAMMLGGVSLLVLLQRRRAQAKV